VYAVVAIPEPSVVFDVGESEPFGADQTTLTPLVATGTWLASASCAEIVTEVPAAGEYELDVTSQWSMGPGI
jgi:hypothetical protein